MIAQILKQPVQTYLPEIFDTNYLYNDNQNLKEIVVYKGAVFVQGDFANAATKKIFYKQGYEIVDDLDLADIVVWTGGEDINPKIYNEVPAGAQDWNNFRDDADLQAIRKAKNQFKVGICRGAQLLNCVPNGGKLWQDVDKHGGYDHSVVDLITKKAYTINSLHHQQMIPTEKAEVIAVTRLSTYKKAQGRVWEFGKDSNDADVEALWYPETKSLCVQWHPEFSRPGDDSHDYLFNLLDRYYHAA